MYETLSILGIAFAVLAGGFLITSIAMFFGYNIPVLRKDVSGALEQKQIEEIRKNNSDLTNRRGRVNVFEELEKKAKVKKGNIHSLNSTPVNPSQQVYTDAGTSVLSSGAKQLNPEFIIEKNIVFVSTNEVI